MNLEPARYYPATNPRQGGTVAPPESLRALAQVVRASIASVDAVLGSYADDPANWHRRHREAMDRVAAMLTESHGARIVEKNGVWHVRLGGLPSSSTGGIAAALNNWCVAVDRRQRGNG